MTCLNENRAILLIINMLWEFHAVALWGDSEKIGNNKFALIYELGIIK